MNLVEVIQSQMTSVLTSKLSAMLDVDEKKAEAASKAAIPALFSVFSGFVSHRSGAELLTDKLNQFERDDRERVAGFMDSRPTEAARCGYQFLVDLLGQSTVTSLTCALVRYLGSSTDAVKKLVGYLAPVILGQVSKQFHGEEITTQGLANLFENQRSHVAHALPKGLSLDEIPGPSSLGRSRRKSDDVRQDVEPSPVRTWAPVAALVLLALLAWNFFQAPQLADSDVVSQKSLAGPVQYEAMKPVSPVEESDSPASLTQFSDELEQVMATLRDQLSSISNVEEAEEALPKFREISEQLGDLVERRSELPKPELNSAVGQARTELESVSEPIATLEANSEVKNVLEDVLSEIQEKLRTLGN
ncbi:DUF937 domain-containing protein [Thalassoglobus sp. JC818]|uniref:DUF937 domain-containing protein n=1 Tax=Thalassoglobus sp. JC818 TaxID=3232136 RepID=UPI00345B27C6